MGDCTEGAEWHNVVYVVDESHAAFDLGNLVVVKPQLVGANQLLVYERLLLADVLELAQPTFLPYQWYSYTIFHQKAFVHLYW